MANPRAANRAGPNSLQVHAETAEFKRLFDKASRVEPALKTALRRNIRNAANRAADHARTESMVPGRTRAANPVDHGLRAGIRAGIRVNVLTGVRVGVVIVSSSNQMPAGKESLVRGWEAQKGWRHPTFTKAGRTARIVRMIEGGRHGASTKWVTQYGHPFFRQSISERRDDIRSAVEQAMDEALASLRK